MSTLSESWMPENGTSSSMSGTWKQGHGAALRAPETERSGQQTSQTYNYCATFRLYLFESVCVQLT